VIVTHLTTTVIVPHRHHLEDGRNTGRNMLMKIL